MMPAACSKRSGRSCPRVARLALATAAVLAALAALPQQASALPRVQPYVQLSVTPQSLDLGTVPQPGAFDSPAELTVHIAANCNHGGVVISTTGLLTSEGEAIPPERIFVRTQQGGSYVPMTNPVPVIAPAGPGVVEVKVSVRIQTSSSDPAGTYVGKFQSVSPGGTRGPDIHTPDVSVSLNLEMYCGYEIRDSQCYVHLGNVFVAELDDLTLRVAGTLNANMGMYVGLNLSGLGSPWHQPVERDSQGNPTGRILGAMHGTVDVLGRDISQETFDVHVAMSWNGGASFSPPEYFGTAPDGSVANSLWWLVGDGSPGRYDMAWDVRLLPGNAQADGNYRFVPELVVTPRL